MARNGDRFTVSADGGGVVAVFGRGHWDVMGPRVVRGGRVDQKQQEHYGYVLADGTIHNYGGRGRAGYHHGIYLEIARDKIAGGLGGMGHITPGPEPQSMAEPTAMTSGVLTVSNKPYPRGETIRRLEAAGISSRVGKSPIAGTVLIHIDPQHGHKAFRIKNEVEREWLDVKHGRGGGTSGGKRRSPKKSSHGKPTKRRRAKMPVHKMRLGRPRVSDEQLDEAEAELKYRLGGKRRRHAHPARPSRLTALVADLNRLTK